MTQYGDGQGEAGQQPNWPQDRPRLGNQYGQQDYGRQQWGQPEQQQWGQGAPGQQPAGQPQIPQGGYDRPPQRSAPATPSPYSSGYRLDPGPQRTLGVPGLIVTIVGAILLIVSFTALDWYHNISGDRFGGGGSSGKFSDIHHGLDTLNAQLSGNPAAANSFSFGISRTYFGWLGWVLLAAAIVFALISVLPTPLTPAMRAISFLVGLAGAGFTVWAADLFSVTGPLAEVVQRQGLNPTFSFWIKHSYLGAWFAVGGFVIVAFGGLMGSTRRR